MFHPAKVKEKIDAGQDTVFLVETWDENVFTLAAADDLEINAVDTDDVVLIDYYPDEAFDLPSPRQVVSAVLNGEEADRIWERYREMFNDSGGPQTAQMQFPNQQPFEGGYIG